MPAPPAPPIRQPPITTTPESVMALQTENAFPVHIGDSRIGGDQPAPFIAIPFVQDIGIQFLSFTNPISIPKCSTDDPAAFPGLNTSGLRQADFQRFENRYISNRSQEPPYFIDLGIGAIRRVRSIQLADKRPNVVITPARPIPFPHLAAPSRPQVDRSRPIHEAHRATVVSARSPLPARC
jgi:hypothetical protein